MAHNTLTSTSDSDKRQRNSNLILFAVKRKTVLVHAKEAYTEVELQVHAFLFFAPDGGKWLVPRSCRLFPVEVDPVPITGGGREG